MAKLQLPLRFSLRTLFVVVTVLGAMFGWLAWQRRIVLERKEVFLMFASRSEAPLVWRSRTDAITTVILWNGDLSHLDWVRRLLGEDILGFHVEGIFTQNECARIQRYFPEAEFYAGRDLSSDASFPPPMLPGEVTADAP